MINDKFIKEEMTTLAACMNNLREQGFNANFIVNEQGLHDLDTNKTYAPRETTILSFYRFEGESDPADNSILYAIETLDNAKGLLVDAYGAYSDEKVARFIGNVEDITKASHNTDEEV